MLNSLANHAFLPHSGKDITLETTIRALSTALNVNGSLSEFLHANAVTTNPTPNATTFSLNDLSTHDILEHDASLRLVAICVLIPGFRVSRLCRTKCFLESQSCPPVTNGV
jgi:hypothetical protein